MAEKKLSEQELKIYKALLRGRGVLLSLIPKRSTNFTPNSQRQHRDLPSPRAAPYVPKIGRNEEVITVAEKM